MDRTERFYLIERLLRERRHVTRQQLIEALEVSLATLKRDLAYMRDRLRAPIVWNADAGGYELDTRATGNNAFALPGLWFNPSEIHALLTMDALLSELEPGLLGHHVALLRARLETLLEEGRLDARELRRRIRITRQAARSPAPGVFDCVAVATLQRRRIRIRYAGRGSGQTTDRDISPQRLVHYRDNWYVDAWCHLRDGLRKFAVDAIAGAELLDAAAEDVDLAIIERELDSGYGAFGGATVEWAKLRFSPLRARWVAQERWHPAQRSRFLADGSYELEVPFADARELLMDVLKHGAEVEVLAPPSLATALAAEIARMWQRLSGTPAGEAAGPTPASDLEDPVR